MKEVVDSKSVVSRFVGKYLGLAIVIGGISFILENLIPQIANWSFRSSVFLIYQSVLFIISTLLTVTLAVSGSIKQVKIKSEEEAKKIVAPIVTILIFIALALLSINLVYCYQLEKSEKVDIEKRYEPIKEEDSETVEEINEYNQLRKQIELNDAHTVSTIYMATKEILIILTYSYAAIYIEKMLKESVVTEEEKKKVETTKKVEQPKTVAKTTAPKATAPKTTAAKTTAPKATATKPATTPKTTSKKTTTTKK